MHQSQIDAEEMLHSDKYNADSLYVLDNAVLSQAMASLGRSHDVLAQIDGLNVLAPGSRDCRDCLAVADIETPQQISAR